MNSDRLPPYSELAEEALLGCCLLEPRENLGLCVEQFGRLEIFYDLRRQTIYSTLLTMYDSGEAIDIVTVSQRLKDKCLLDQVGGTSYLSMLPEKSPAASSASYYAEIVYEKYILRRMIHTCTDVVSRVYNHSGDVNEMLDQAERDILKIRPAQRQQRVSAKDLVVEAHEKMERMFNNRGSIMGLSTSFPELDRLTDGLHPGEMIVVAAFPSMGKSCLSMNIACAQALLGNSVGVFSLEMTPQEIMQRSIYAEAGVNPYNIRDGTAGDVHFERMSRASDRLMKAPFHIENCNGMTIQQLRACARRLKQEQDIKLAVVDYIQLLSCPADSREQEVSSISKGIKSMAMELNIPIIALSQLNDDGKLRESRAIGQDADSVWLINADGDKKPVIQPVKIIVTKHRNGATGAVPLTFEKCYTRFVTPPKVTDEDMPS